MTKTIKGATNDLLVMGKTQTKKVNEYLTEFIWSTIVWTITAAWAAFSSANIVSILMCGLLLKFSSDNEDRYSSAISAISKKFKKAQQIQILI